MLKEQSLKEPGWKGYLIQILSGILQPIPIKEFKEVFFTFFLFLIIIPIGLVFSYFD